MKQEKKQRIFELLKKPEVVTIIIITERIY